MFSERDDKQTTALFALSALCVGTDSQTGVEFPLSNNRQLAAVVFNRGTPEMLSRLQKNATHCKIKLPDPCLLRCTEDELDSAITKALKTSELRAVKERVNQ